MRPPTLRTTISYRQSGAADVFVIAAMQSEGLDAVSRAGNKLLAELERVARDLSDRENGFQVFVDERDGTSCLPFFSSLKQCQTFCGEYSASVQTASFHSKYWESGEQFSPHAPRASSKWC